MNIDSYEDVLDYLRAYFIKTVKDECYLAELLVLVEGSRSEETVTIRAIYEKYMNYIRENKENIDHIKGDKEMWSKILYFWQ